MPQPTVKLNIFKGDKLVDQKTLSQDVIKIGALKSSHVYLSDPSVARMHAVIEVSGNDLRLVDLGSPKGTGLNGRGIEKNAAVTHGDVLQVGAYRIELELLPDHAAAAMVHAPAALPRVIATDARAPQIDVNLEDVELDNGNEVAEVVAMYGRTVLDVGHVGQVKSRRATAIPLLAVGGFMTVAGLGVFGYEVSRDWSAYQEAKSAASLAEAPAPAKPGWGTGPLGFGFALLGLIPFVSGGLRMREDVLENYTIGEAHHASFHVPTQGLPDSDAYPLVRAAGGEFSLNFTDSMTGDVSVDGQRVDLKELVRSGKARAAAGAYHYALPRGGSARVKHNDISFHINAVKPGAKVAGRGEADWPFWAFVGGTGAVALSVWTLLRAFPADMLGFALDNDGNDDRFARYMFQPDEQREEEEAPSDVEESDEAAGGEGQRSEGEEGQMGKPTSKAKAKLYSMKGPKDAVPQISRTRDPDMAARTAGILGVMQQQSGSFIAGPHGGAFAIGNEDADIWGGLTGTEVGESYGVGGLGLIGTGNGGGGHGQGVVGLGHTGLIGKGGGGHGKGSGYGRGSGSGFGSKGKNVPTVHIARAKVQGSLDKDIVRRIVRSHINEVRGCYNKGLSKNPNLQGRVAINFVIGNTGKVASSAVQETSLKDRGVANCIAKAVKRWKFPRPRGGGSVIVSYPFSLSAA